MSSLQVASILVPNLLAHDITACLERISFKVVDHKFGAFVNFIDLKVLAVLAITALVLLNFLIYGTFLAMLVVVLS